MSQRRQLKWADTAMTGTANKFAGWDGSGNPTEKDGGGTSSGAANELQKNNGSSGFSGTGLFSTTDGNILLGATAGAGTSRQISPQGASPTIQLNIASKGNALVSITGTTLAIIGTSSERIDVDPILVKIYNTKQATDKTIKLAGAAGNNAGGAANGDSAQIIGGDADQTAGNGNGGTIFLTPGIGHGSGKAGNIAFFTTDTSFGSGANVIKILKTPTPATASVVNSILLWAESSSDATATLAVYLEQAVEVIGTFTASHKLKIKINGTEYWIQLDAV